VLDTGLRAVHVLAIIVYLGGGLLLHGPVRRALRLVPPGQASIVGSQVGKDFTIVSWASLALWGISGYWMLFRYITFILRPRLETKIPSESTVLPQSEPSPA
jgi:uncharacterized membrane protein